MEAGTSLTHPLISELAPIFAELQSSSGTDISHDHSLWSCVSKLEHLLEEEKDTLSYRNSMRVVGAHTKVFASWINQQVKELLRKRQTMRIGVRFVQALLKVDYMDANEMAVFFSHLLMQAVLKTEVLSLALEASSLWGGILQTRSSSIEKLIQDTLEAILAVLKVGRSSPAADPDPLSLLVLGEDASCGARCEKIQLAACLLLCQIVEFSAAGALPRVNEILECLQNVVMSSDSNVRLTASKTLQHALRLTYRGLPSEYQRVQETVLMDSLKGISASPSGDSLHGSLLLFNAFMASFTEVPSLNTRPPAARTTTTPPPPSVVKLSQKTQQSISMISNRINALLVARNNSMEITDAVHEALPLLALHDRTLFMSTTAVSVREVCALTFTGPQCRELTASLISSSRSRDCGDSHLRDLRSALFTLLSQLTRVIPDFVFSFAHQVMAYIEGSLVQYPEAATCFATLAESRPKLVRPFLRSVMGSLFGGAMTTGLARDVAKICTAFPGLRSTCLSKVLHSAKAQLEALPPRCGTDDKPEASVFILSIFEALDSLDFSGYSTLLFLSETVLPYVTDLHEDVRRSAVYLCFKLVHCGCINSPCRLLESGVMIHCGKEHNHLLKVVVKRLCDVAVADTNSDIRLQTLLKFTRAFDHTLALLDSTLLGPAMYDKFQNVAAATRLLGRVSSLNPAAIYPTLRQLLKQLLSDIEYLKSPKRQGQSITVIAIVAESAPQLIRPYASSLLRKCAERLQDSTLPSMIVKSLLCCAGKLSRYAEGPDIEVVRRMQPTIVQYVLDSTTQFPKHEAIQALCDVIRTTQEIGVLEYQLLGSLMNSLHGGLKERLVVRLDILRLVGIIGAIDPHRMKQVTRHSGGGILQKTARIAVFEYDKSLYPQQVVQQVLETLKLPSITVDQCVCALTVITRILSSKELNPEILVPYHYSLLDSILRHASQYEDEREQLLALLTTTVQLMGNHIRPFAGHIVEKVIAFLPAADGITLQRILRLFVALREILREEFRSHLRELLPHLSNSSAHHLSSPHTVSLVFRFYSDICPLLDSSIHTILPNVCEAASSPSVFPSCREQAICTICSFASQLPSLALDAPRCIHCLCGVLKEFHSSLSLSPDGLSIQDDTPRIACLTLSALACVAFNLGPQFEKFLPMVKHVLADFNCSTSAIRHLLRQTRDLWRNEIKHYDDDISNAPITPHQKETPMAPLRNPETVEDWGQWMHQLSVKLLRMSPSFSHQFAAELALKHAPFARHIFHSAFRVMHEQDRPRSKVFLKDLEKVLSRGNCVPAEVLQEILNLSEYMERVLLRCTRSHQWTTAQEGLLFDINTLMDCSQRCHLYAKALHYVELQFSDLTAKYAASRNQGGNMEEWQRLLELCEKTIYLYNLLGHRESAQSILQYIESNVLALSRKSSESSFLSHLMDAQLFEKLQWWSKSHKAYSLMLQKEPHNVSHMVGYLRSLDNLGAYNRILEAWRTFSAKVHPDEWTKLSPYAAHAAWFLRRWDDMKAIADHMPVEGPNATVAIFYKAVVAVSQRQVHRAEQFIQQCRRRLDSGVSTLIAESYERAYSEFIGCQQLSELEEMLLAISGHRTRQHWQEIWERRLVGMAYEGWKGTMTNHTMMISQLDELNMWLKFVNLSRLNGHEFIGSDVLSQLRGNRTIESAVVATERSAVIDPALALASCQLVYDKEERGKAIALLTSYVQINGVESSGEFAINQKASLALCYSKLSLWLFQRHQHDADFITSGCFKRVIHHVQVATKLDRNNDVIWRTWARIHAEMIVTLPPTSTALSSHVTQALHGYVESLCLTRELSDSLGFLSLWFTYGDRVDYYETVNAMKRIPAIVWLMVVPQIIARLQSNREYVSKSVFELLGHVANAHPQALLYPLSVANASYGLAACNSTEAAPGSHTAAGKLLEMIAERNGSALVADAALVCEEVVRCAALWPEMWGEAVERVLECGMDSLYEVLRVTIKPLMTLLESPASGWEQHFADELRIPLERWFAAMSEVAVTKSVEMRQKVFEDYRSVFETIRDARYQLQDISTLSLSTVSPALVADGKDLTLVVPGKYQESGEYPCIACFEEKLEVMSTKQRPRKMHIWGTDGVRYLFLLKGHGDLRLDERVMQVLSFVNVLLEKHSATSQRDCAIHTYSVTPLSESAGLVGWVNDSNTLHNLVLEYRHTPNEIYIERWAMKNEVKSFESMRPIQLLEQLENALKTTPGSDLSNSLWIKAPSAEVWLDRRTTYVCSLATMSMVGHILGLGDRHPSNLMIHTFSGRVIHIDFGECFEAAQLRRMQPENVPFRLTRMLVNALEVGGINGLFRHGCVTVMKVLRKEGGSILALLEAFVHDPLVSRSDEPEVLQNESELQEYTKLLQYYKSRDPQDAQLVGSHVLHRLRHDSMIAPPAARALRMCRETGTHLYHPPQRHEVILTKAQRAVKRIKEKLEGYDFLDNREPHLTNNINQLALTVDSQVQRLIDEARSHENICSHYIGWCPFW